MRILLLGPMRPTVIAHMERHGDDVSLTEQPLYYASSVLDATDFIVSYGYRHVLGKRLVSRFRGRMINLHISLLPWNRGADANLWSFLEDTPKGVSIHYVDEGVDTGPLLAQRELRLRADETLRTSYDKLGAAMEQLFFDAWPAIRGGTLPGITQRAGGSIHHLADKNPYMHLLTKGWDTPVAGLIGRAKYVPSLAPAYV